MRRRMLFLLGGAAGAGLDQIHVRTGVLSYASPGRVGQPWWVAPQFGAAAVVLFEAARPFSVQADAPGQVTLASDVAWLVGSYAASGLWRRRPRALAVALYLSWAARTIARTDRRSVVTYGALLALLGCAYEHRLAGTGAFSYFRPDLGNVPAWLPGLYLHGAPLALDLARGASA